MTGDYGANAPPPPTGGQPPPPPGWAPPPPGEQPLPPQPPKKPFYKKWWFIALVAVLVIGILANAVGQSDPRTDAAGPAAGRSSTTAATTDGPEPTSSAATSTTPRTTTSSVSPPPTTSAPPPPAAVYSGAGDDVVAIVKPVTGVVMVSVEGNNDGGFFAVQGVDGDQDLLVNTTDPYDGTRLMDVQGGETTQLQVTATGPWTITINSIAAAVRFTGAFNGARDSVLLYEGSAGVAHITGNPQARFFAVEVYTDTDSDLLINTTDTYDGRVPFPEGLALVAITAMGPWAIAVT